MARSNLRRSEGALAAALPSAPQIALKGAAGITFGDTALRVTLTVNAREYLTDLFTRLPTATTRTVRELTPKAWAQEQRRQQQTHALTAASLAAL